MKTQTVKIAEKNKLLDEVWLKAYGEFLGSLSKYEVVEGQKRPDIGYSPSQ